ncbi:MATE family efflux transporter [Marivita sp. GX14005]|uniref:MATE family efflux transporter n=1 Tax=Marivita sp. GX14005 TaxID=2942276 RepID=UPI00201A17E6|nr:MATE family efflux transporter [Marivita sp. GX14005]MCL3882246.1 MATE family efflux transporter [Marivita sp. GX14005]
MAAAQTDDLTTGSLLTHYRNLAIPSAFGMLFATLYNVVDVYFAGRLSTEAQAGLAIGYQAFFIMMAVGFGLGSALSALVSNAKGERNPGAARSLAAQGLTFGAIATALLMLLGSWGGPHLIRLISEPGGYRDAALGYFGWLIFALPGFLMAYGANGILQAHGDTHSMQRALMAAFVANVVLNPLLIWGIPGLWGGMGFDGIAASTILSQTGVMLFILTRIFRLPLMDRVHRAEFVPDPSCFKAIVEQMAPASTAMIVMFVSGFVVQFALKEFGEEAIAGYGVALRIEQILLLPVLGMTGALLPITGQNFGARQFDRVREALFLCWKLGFAIAAVAMPLLWFAGAWAMRPFTSDAEVIEIGASYLLVDGFLFPVYMMLFSVNSYLQGLKRPIYTLWISIYRQGFGVAFFIWFYVFVLGSGIWGVWLGIATAVSSGWVVALLVAFRISRREMNGLRPAPA